ncbi:universal stress protein [Actinomadura barringtoniae]|uniref:Universal stress protein n=1 Tax=Actinomadura barringtoniae TaxID=1427535 RepID=A0A939T1N6_9ACTN|nr:universal stress protein [Actinomadura barringtoniae]MBO2447951.1 universal stress protein [Actinomadura barringtoniae]
MVTYPNVLVGYDGTDEGEAALRWAVEEARLRGRDLLVCHCWRWPFPISYIDYDIEHVVRRMGEHLLDQGVARARRLAPSLTVHKRLMDGPAYAALMHESLDAEVIVVGAHGGGVHERDEVVLGSTALQLPARSRRPVVVVREPGDRHERVVVGVDGSAGGDAALALAFEEAALRGWRLQAVHGCWDPGAVARTEIALFADEDQLKRSCGELLERTVAPWRVKYPHVEAETSLMLEGPRESLMAAAGAAGLIVLGSRGGGGIKPMLLGATSTALLQHAPCSVAIAPSMRPS